MGTFRFTQEYHVYRLRKETYEITADSYEDAVKMIEAAGRLNDVDGAEHIESTEIAPDWWELDEERINMLVFNEDGQEVI